VRRKCTHAEYEELWRSDPQGHGCISVQQAVASLQMDEASISMLIERGALDGFDVGEDPTYRIVTLASLLKLKAARAVSTSEKDRPTRILETLTEAARNKRTLCYGDVMQAMGLTYSDGLHRRMFNEDVREATRRSELFSHGLLLSALLVFKLQQMADDDFFLMAKELGMYKPGGHSKTGFFKGQVDRIFAFYGQAGRSGE
jgi:hypothetical protein